MRAAHAGMSRGSTTCSRQTHRTITSTISRRWHVTTKPDGVWASSPDPPFIKGGTKGQNCMSTDIDQGARRSVHTRRTVYGTHTARNRPQPPDYAGGDRGQCHGMV